jgi:hypothetical protein
MANAQSAFPTLPAPAQTIFPFFAATIAFKKAPTSFS